MRNDINKIKIAALAGGKVLKSYFGKNIKTAEKLTVNDLVTAADLRSEKEIMNILQKEFPTYNIFSEEKGVINKNSDYTFIVDPLDGTYNFTIGIPDFSVSIALKHKNNLIAGAVYNPISEQLYWAGKNKGAFLNNRKIKVSKIKNINSATVVYTCNYLTPRSYLLNLNRRLFKEKVKRFLNNWSVALDVCLVARGMVDAMIVNDNDIYDYAAGKLIALEAGALVTDLKGHKEKCGRNNTFLISNGQVLHDKVLKLL